MTRSTSDSPIEPMITTHETLAIYTSSLYPVWSAKCTKAAPTFEDNGHETPITTTCITNGMGIGDAERLIACLIKLSIVTPICALPSGFNQFSARCHPPCSVNDEKDDKLVHRSMSMLVVSRRGSIYKVAFNRLKCKKQ